MSKLKDFESNLLISHPTNPVLCHARKFTEHLKLYIRRHGMDNMPIDVVGREGKRRVVNGVTLLQAATGIIKMLHALHSRFMSDIAFTFTLTPIKEEV